MAERLTVGLAFYVEASFLRLRGIGDRVVQPERAAGVEVVVVGVSAEGGARLTRGLRGLIPVRSVVAVARRRIASSVSNSAIRRFAAVSSAFSPHDKPGSRPLSMRPLPGPGVDRLRGDADPARPRPPAAAATISSSLRRNSGGYPRLPTTASSRDQVAKIPATQLAERGTHQPRSNSAQV
jgi:hypothetical protein